MTGVPEIIFWLCIMFVFYIYFGYPLLLFILSRLRPAPRVKKGDISLNISLIIPAYNEEKVIADKIENSLLLDYPKEELEIIVASDGSTDKTNQIVRSFATLGVKLVLLNTNQGKSSAQNLAVTQARGEIIFFSDANVLLLPDAVKKIVRSFADPNVGCVVGKVIYLNQEDTSVSQGEGLYWRYELFLRAKESKLGNFAMGSGPIMAIRRSLFQPLDPDVGEDFVLPLQTVMVRLLGNISSITSLFIKETRRF